MGLSLHSVKKSVGFILGTIMMAGAVTGIARADDTLDITFTPTDAGGSYGTKYVQAVWLTTTGGQRICTVGTGGGKVALWAYTRYSSVYTWYNNNPTYRGDDRTDRTGATQNGYREYHIAWDWKKYNTPDPDGTVVPDGSYRLEFECSNGNDSAALNRLTVPITKGRTGWVLTPPNGDFLNVRIEHIPSGLTVVNTGATDVTEMSARLNGQITDTGGENPTVFIYWGQTDAGTNPGNWEHAVNLGVLGAGTFATDIAGLTAGTTYYYRCRAINSTKDVWANAAESFDAVNVNTIFEEGDPWKYFKGYSTPANWNGLGFADSSWLSGPTGIGYGDGDDATVLSDMANNYITVYMRYAFHVDLPSSVTGLQFTVDYDDGFVAFINGQEVVRRGVNAGQTKDTTAADHEASVGGGSAEVIDLSAYIGYLAEGANVFAIEVHNATSGSSDLSMIPTLVMHGGMMPPQGNIRLSRESLDFGDIDTGQTVTRDFTIENIGALPLEIQALTLTGLSADAYSILSPAAGFPITLDAAQTQQVMVQYNPAAPGEHPYASLAVASDDPDEPVASVTLSGHNGPQALYALRPVGGMGGTANVVVEYGSHLLLGQGAVLSVLDVADAAHPKAFKQIRLPDTIEAIAVHNDIAYVAAGAAGLLVVDLNAVPSVVAPLQINTMGHASDVSCVGTYLCLADGIGGMQLYDLFDPAAPSLLETYRTTGHVRAVRISGDTAYALDNKALTAIPLNSLPLEAAWQFDEVQFGQALEIVSGKAYISDTLGGFFIVDLAAAPTMRGQIRSQAGAASAIQVINSLAYLSVAGGLEVMDIADADNPASLLVVPTAGQPSDAAILNETLYLADGSAGVRVMSLAVPSAPAEIGSYEVQAPATAVAGPSAAQIYAAQGRDGLAAVDLSKPLDPTQSSLLTTGSNVRDIAVNGQYAYLACGADGLQIVDISLPSAPVLKGSFATAGFCTRVACSGSTAVLTDGNSLYAVNVSNPMTPVLIREWTDAGWFFDAAIDGSTIYAAVGGMGVQVYTVGSNDSIGSYPADGIAYGIMVSGTAAYVAAGTEGLLILDISTPSAPSLLGHYDTTGIAMAVAASGTRVCLAEAGFGVTVIDTSNPAAPVLYARSAWPKNAFNLMTVDSRVFVADAKDGLAVLAVAAQPTDPPADINRSGLVEIGDLVTLADNWLAVETNLTVLPGNVYYYDTDVNLNDLSVLSEFWQRAYDSTQDPAVYLKLDETSGGSAADSSANGYDGVLINMDSSDWVPGKKANALDFDGINDYVQLTGYKGITGSASRTCTAWIKTIKPSSQIINWGANDPGTKWALRINEDGTLRAEVSGGYLAGITNLCDGQWHHVATVLTDDGSPNINETKLYVDGQPEPIGSSAAYSVNTAAAENVKIGVNIIGTVFFEGLIDEVRIYDRALSGQEILALSE
jgi:hypothetical protein